CDDGNPCTTDGCQTRGGCTHDQIACNSPPGDCYEAIGTCSGGNCSYGFRSGNCGSNPPTACGGTDCHICDGSGNCVLNSPHYDASCRPSCGALASQCGVTPGT